VCGAPHPCECRERRFTGCALAVGVGTDLGGLRCLTLRYSLPLSMWVDPHAEHIYLSCVRSYHISAPFLLRRILAFGCWDARRRASRFPLLPPKAKGEADRGAHAGKHPKGTDAPRNLQHQRRRVSDTTSLYMYI